MPATLTKPDDDPSKYPPELGRIIEKIKRRGSNALTEAERVMVVQIFRGAAITNDKRIQEAKHAIQKAHLYYCWRMTK
jgi:hypothetical protein